MAMIIIEVEALLLVPLRCSTSIIIVLTQDGKTLQKWKIGMADAVVIFHF
jgi:hypothetical protein